MPIMTVSFYLLFLPMEGAGAGYLFACVMGLYLALTMILIPYYAWAAELSPDYAERSRITGWRSAIGIVGNMLAQAEALGLGDGESDLTRQNLAERAVT